MKPVLRGHPRDPRYCPLNRGVHLVQVYFLQKIREEKYWSLLRLVKLDAGCPLNTGFTVINQETDQYMKYLVNFT